MKWLAHYLVEINRARIFAGKTIVGYNNPIGKRGVPVRQEWPSQ